jgi:hypothetical protein
MDDDPIFKDGYYVYSDGCMIPESDAIEGLSTMYDRDDSREETIVRNMDDI